ncbi:MAG TPA: arginine--tRNA ligase [Acidimicrobiales bacterium]|nr:arginine--tRNA ligase [Acidimicrobiales bacterium]
MANPVTELADRLRRAMAGALGPEFADADPVLRRSGQPRFGDYQANAAMGLAKRVGRPPRDVAAASVEARDAGARCSSVEVAGPGFINLTFTPEALGEAARSLVGDERLGVPGGGGGPGPVVVDYSSPNLAKEMHVGHLRSTIIGDALVRTLAFAGATVVRQNHFGEWGTQFGQLIEHLAETGQAEGEVSIADLNSFYQDAHKRFQTDEEFRERSRRRVVALQSGEPATVALWQKFVSASMSHAAETYGLLGVTLRPQDAAPESSFNPVLEGIASELEAKGLARVDDGALCAFPPGFTGRDGTPLPLMIRKSDGGYGYQATDLAAIRHRVADLGGRRIIYVVDARQSQHLAMVFEVARQAGWAPEGVVLEHVAFGMVLGPDGRPFQTRSGQSVKLTDLLHEAVERAAAVVADKNPDLDDRERDDVARLVGVGAVKYADLANDRVKDYVFEWDRMLAFDGNTAPYLQYAHARIRSIFRKSETGLGLDPGSPAPAVTVGETAERALVLQLLALPEVVAAVVDSLQPHRLCTYLFELASAFTSFYEACPVLRAPDEATRSSRLALCGLTARTLALGLGLLGIEAPERM